MKNKGLIFSLILAAGVIIYVMASGGVHAEKCDDSRYLHDRTTDTAAHSDADRSDRAVTDEPEEVTWLDQVLTKMALKEEEDGDSDLLATDSPDADTGGFCDDPVDIDTPDNELLDEEVIEDEAVQRAGDDAGVYPDDPDSGDNSGDAVRSDEADTDLWELGLTEWGISYQDTDRALRLITYEGYGDSWLSYYVACCCWVRATEGYWGYGNLYSAFGEIDTQYGTWMDSLGVADYAYTYLRICYEDPTYCRYCNGLIVPDEYIYTEGGIYVWN